MFGQGMADITSDEDPKVLMVDDEKEVANAYALRLQGVAEVDTAHGGDDALSIIDNSDDPPDVILLDRHMPGQSGDDVLQSIRERDVRTRVIMVTAIDPGLDILELPFDDYLCKPVERDDLRIAVREQCQVLAYELLGEYFHLESKRAVIEAELPPDDLESHNQFQDLKSQIDDLKHRTTRLLPEADELIDRFSGVDREGL